MEGASFIGSDKGQIMLILRDGLLGVMEERSLGERLQEVSN